MEYYLRYFNTYLNILKKDHDEDKSLSYLIKSCNVSLWELIGMINLLSAMGEIDFETEQREKSRVLEEFSTIKLFNAYVEDGEIMVFGN